MAALEETLRPRVPGPRPWPWPFLYWKRFIRFDWVENGLLELRIRGPQMRGEILRMGNKDEAEVMISRVHRVIGCRKYGACLTVAGHKWNKDYMNWTCRGCPMAAGHLQGS